MRHFTHERDEKFRKKTNNFNITAKQTQWCFLYTLTSTEIKKTRAFKSEKRR